MHEDDETKKTDDGVSRRTFVRSAAIAGAGVTIVPRHVLGRGFQAPSDTVNIATVGIGGMGGSNTRSLMSQNIVAICDVDPGPASRRASPPTNGIRRGCRRRHRRRAPSGERTKAQLDANARRPAQNTLEQPHALPRRAAPEGPALHGLPGDAREAERHRRVVVATPDHMHAAIAIGRDGRRQARLRAEAVVLVGAGSASPGAEGEGDRRRDPDGQPGPLDRRRAARVRIHHRRRDRRHPRSARLDQPSARILAAGSSAPGAASAAERASGRCRGTDQASKRGLPRRSPATTRCLTAWPGTCSSAWRRRSNITRSITRSTGAAGSTGGRARSATWARTSSIIRSGR